MIQLNTMKNFIKSRRVSCVVVAASLTSTALLLGACAGGAGGGGAVSGRHVPGTTEENIISHEVTAEDRAKAQSKQAIAANEAVLYVNGMGCPLCATNINMQLERVPGVTDVKVDLGVGKVTIGMLPGTKHPSPAVLGEAVEDAGFTLVKVEER